MCLHRRLISPGTVMVHAPDHPIERPARQRPRPERSPAPAPDTAPEPVMGAVSSGFWYRSIDPEAER
jgi:hypothetical protein